MDTLAQTIHKEFRSSLDVASLKLPEITMTQEQQATESLLKDLGLTSSKTYARVAELKRKEASLHAERSMINRLKAIETRYPTYRIISLKKVIELMTKYNLCFSSISNYIEEVPIENAKAIQEYKTTVIYDEAVRDRYSSTHNSLFDNVDGFSSRFGSGMCMVAPRTFFSKTLTNIDGFLCSHISKPQLTLKVNMEQFAIPSRNTDPIVLNPIIQQDGLFFHIVTAWDLEAYDPEVTNKVEITNNNN
jgi:hypothetical protein